MATLLSDLTMRVRDALRDYPKTRTDQINADGVQTTFDFGKDLGIQTGTETVTVAGAAKVRGTDYQIGPVFGATPLWGSNQIAFATPPAAAALIKVVFQEVIWRDEKIWEEVNAGRKMLYMKHYRAGTATITIRNLVRDYDLTSADVNESTMRTVLAQGHMGYALLRTDYQPNATGDQLWVPYRSYEEVGESAIHLYRLLPAAYTLRLHVIYNFTPLVNATDPTDVPDMLQDLVVLWAVGMLALKQEPTRARIDTANVLQSTFANPPGLMPQTAEDFKAAWLAMRNAIPSRPPSFVMPDRPLRFQFARSR